MPPDGALEALRLALRSGGSQVAIASIHWARYLEQRRTLADRSFYRKLLSESGAHATQRSTQPAVKPKIKSGFAPAAPALEAIESLPAAMREAALLRTIAEIVRRTLDLHSGEEIDPDVPLGDLGMDPLLAIELRNGLSGYFTSNSNQRCFLIIRRCGPWQGFWTKKSCLHMRKRRRPCR